MSTQIKGDFAALRWVMKKGIDLQGFRLEVDGKKRSGMVLLKLIRGENERNEVEIAVYYAKRGKLQNVDEAATEYGRTALTRAYARGHLSIVNSLLLAGADKDEADDGGHAPLYMAADRGHLEVVKALLAAGAEKDKATDGGRAPLYMATYGGHLEVVEALLSAGADWTKMDEYGKTALYMAEEMGHTDVALVLEQAE